MIYASQDHSHEWEGGCGVAMIVQVAWTNDQGKSNDGCVHMLIDPAAADLTLTRDCTQEIQHMNQQHTGNKEGAPTNAWEELNTGHVGYFGLSVEVFPCASMRLSKRPHTILIRNR